MVQFDDDDDHGSLYKPADELSWASAKGMISLLVLKLGCISRRKSNGVAQGYLRMEDDPLQIEELNDRKRFRSPENVPQTRF
ncbi:unnamed protein product [Nippostrongylus brasiliensis]|uniref:Uncharacterized protein n=1 Tax=Nippostrongylus brasiliensis TaxID=27835 RepID=A0A0N4XXQ5_NIPBR|nr:unnamed protein product [Nippostrongylus brasiliensis]